MAALYHCGVHHIFLIPGFFGFTSLGDLHYFGHTQSLLERLLVEQGVQATLHVVATLPTATLPMRAQALHTAINENTVAGDHVHLIGHSTGGLDARMLTSPGLTLPNSVSATGVAERVRSVLCVTTPHLGTPSATFLSSIQGKPLLKLLSLSTLLTLRQGRLPLRVVLKLGECLVHARERATGSSELAEDLYGSLLGRLTPERKRSLETFLSQISSDQALLTQLTPDAMEVFNATTPDRQGVAYGSIIARARRPKKRDLSGALTHPYRTASQAVFRSVYTMASKGEPRDFDPPQAAAMMAAWGEQALATDNDGMVPTSSQFWGQTVRLVQADHLDVLGHFSQRELKPPHYDWLISGSGFRHPDFEALWGDAVSFLLPQLR